MAVKTGALACIAARLCANLAASIARLAATPASRQSPSLGPAMPTAVRRLPSTSGSFATAGAGSPLPGARCGSGGAAPARGRRRRRKKKPPRRHLQLLQRGGTALGDPAPWARRALAALPGLRGSSGRSSAVLLGSRVRPASPPSTLAGCDPRAWPTVTVQPNFSGPSDFSPTVLLGRGGLPAKPPSESSS